jgi:hypothetical protein
VAALISSLSWSRAAMAVAVGFVAALAAFVIVAQGADAPAHPAWFALAWLASLAPNYVMLGALPALREDVR